MTRPVHVTFDDPSSAARADRMLALATRSTSSPCVSIYLPVSPGPEGFEKTRLRLKNLVADAAKQLSTLEHSPDELIDALTPYTEERHVWPHRTRGLVIFATDDSLEIHTVPRRVDELAIVGPRFHMRPLLRLRQGDGTFFVLVLSLHSVRLLEAERHRVHEVEVEGLPDPDAIAHREKDPRTLQGHAVARGGQDLMFHGHGAGDDDAKTVARKWIREVARAIDDHLAGNDAPLVIACVDYLYPLYCEASHYPHIVAQPLEGNFEDVSDEQLRERAWARVEDDFAVWSQEASAHYETRRREGRIASGLWDVLKEASRGKVETLYLRRGEHRWGHFHDDGTFDEVSDQRPGTEDLLDRTALLVRQAGGEVIQLPAEQMPTTAPTAATLRYRE